MAVKHERQRYVFLSLPFVVSRCFFFAAVSSLQAAMTMGFVPASTYRSLMSHSSAKTQVPNVVTAMGMQEGQRNDDTNDDDEEDPVYNDGLIYYSFYSGEAPTPRPKPHHNGREFDADIDLLQKRIEAARVESTVTAQFSRPPRPDLTPVEVVKEVLAALLDPDDPLPDSGIGALFLSSTRRWRMLLRQSVGAPRHSGADVVARALGNAISRPRNQFGILVGADDAEQYIATFPGDVLDYQDGTCWLECRLRDEKDNSLLVTMGWQLKRRSSDGSWLVHRIDWQDFRDRYRPGIGREEWSRSLG